MMRVNRPRHHLERAAMLVGLLLLGHLLLMTSVFHLPSLASRFAVTAMQPHATAMEAAYTSAIPVLDATRHDPIGGIPPRDCLSATTFLPPFFAFTSLLLALAALWARGWPAPVGGGVARVPSRAAPFLAARTRRALLQVFQI